MPRDKYDLLGPIFAEIGSELAQIVGGNPNGAFLYAEAVDGRYSYAIFKEQHDQVRYYRGTRELGDLIWKAWETEEPDKRWAVMEYVVTGKKFDAKFLFPEQIDPEESEMERRPRALKKHFGDKRVIYPPMPQH